MNRKTYECQTNNIKTNSNPIFSPIMKFLQSLFVNIIVPHVLILQNLVAK